MVKSRNEATISFAISGGILLPESWAFSLSRSAVRDRTSNRPSAYSGRADLAGADPGEMGGKKMVESRNEATISFGINLDLYRWRPALSLQVSAVSGGRMLIAES